MPVDSLEQILEKFPGASRPEQIDRALRSLTLATREAQIAMAELMWEVHADRLWRLMRREDGTPYASAFAYYTATVGVFRESRLFAVLRLGRAIRSVPTGSRNWLRDQLAAMPLSRARIIAGAIMNCQSLQDIAVWCERATRLGSPALIEAVKNASEGMTLPRRGPKQSWTPCPTCGRPMKKAAKATV